MGLSVAAGAMMQCSFGVAPATLIVPPSGKVTADGAPMATIMDHKPNTNIPTFGMCSSLANPQVASATSAAQGVLTPQPCIPNTTTPWAPGSPTVTIGNMPALSATSTCNCLWAGVITLTNPGARTVQVP